MLASIKKFLVITSPRGFLSVWDFLVAHFVGVGIPVLLFVGNLLVEAAESFAANGGLWQKMLSPTWYLILGILATAITATLRMVRGKPNSISI